MSIEFIIAAMFLLVPLSIALLGFVGFLAPSSFKSGFNIKANSKKVKLTIEPKPPILIRIIYLIVGVFGLLFFLGVLQAIKTMSSYPH